MFSLFKRKTQNATVPKWASFFSADQYSIFVKAVDEYFAKKHLTYVLGDGELIVDESRFGFGVIGLINTAQTCRQRKPSEYNHIVADFFNSLIRAHEFDVGFKKIIGEFDKVKEYIGVRFYNKDYLARVPEDSRQGKDFAGDIFAMLVFDLPDGITNIKPEDSEKWGKSHEELFDLGIQNMRHKYSIPVEKQTFFDFKIFTVNCDHFFTANILFDLHAKSEFAGPYGVIVAIPHRHAAIIYPIKTLEVVNAINKLIPLIDKMYQEGPGSISNNLLWYNDGKFENLSYKLTKEKIEFYPTVGFTEVLDKLGK